MSCSQHTQEPKGVNTPDASRYTAAPCKNASIEATGMRIR